MRNVGDDGDGYHDHDLDRDGGFYLRDAKMNMVQR